jgi:hypothetical protein
MEYVYVFFAVCGQSIKITGKSYMKRNNYLILFCIEFCRTTTAETQVSLSAFAYLYSELVQYHQNRVDSISELERRLESSGYEVGLKVLELITYRNREVRMPQHNNDADGWSLLVSSCVCCHCFHRPRRDTVIVLHSLTNVLFSAFGGFFLF